MWIQPSGASKEMSELSLWEKAMGWRKRQMVEAQINEVSDKLRNDTLEEVAKEFDKMPFGDTAASFAQFVRDMKR
jgi:transcription elongation GreA/GreB family factor